MARKQVKSVAGKMVAITGGARGIGKATALALIRRGARVANQTDDLRLPRHECTLRIGLAHFGPGSDVEVQIAIAEMA